MLYRDKESQEGLLHVCDNAHKYRKQYIRERAKIHRHDCKVYMLIDGNMQSIKFCPYCGANVENEEAETKEFFQDKF